MSTIGSTSSPRTAHAQVREIRASTHVARRHIVSGPSRRRCRSGRGPFICNAWREIASRPWTIIIAAIALLLWSVRFDVAFLELTRDNLAAGMLWTIMTGPLLHVTQLHLVLDVMGLLIIGWMLEPRIGRAMPIVMGATSFAVALVFVAIYPELSAYRGLSALTHGVLAAGAVALWRQDDRWLASIIALVLIGKCAFELIGDSVSAAAVFGHAESYGSPVPWTHAGAAIAGVMAAGRAGALLPAAGRNRYSRRQRASSPRDRSNVASSTASR